MSRPRDNERPVTIWPNREKRCPRCGDVKPWRAFYVLSRHEDGTVSRVRSKCKLCESEIAREKWATKDRERRARDNARRQATHHERMRTDPEYAERMRAYAREFAARKYWTDEEYRERQRAEARERAKRPENRARERERRARQRAERERERNVELPIGPFLRWLEEQRARVDGEAELAALVGVSERVVFRWEHESRSIRLDTVDAALCSAGDPGALMELWPELYADEGVAA